MGFTNDLLTGLAQYLHDRGVGVWRTGEAVYEDGEVGIVLGEPGDDPPALVALMPYNAGDHPALSDSRQSVQFRLRSANQLPDQANDLADGVFDELQGLWGQTINGVRIVYVTRGSSLQLGTDSNGRYERTDNYDLDVHRPSPHRQ